MFALESGARQCCHSPLLSNTAFTLSHGNKAREKKKRKKRKINTLYFLTCTDSRSNLTHRRASRERKQVVEEVTEEGAVGGQCEKSTYIVMSYIILYTN